MSTAVATIETQVTQQVEPGQLTQAQVQLLKDTLCKGATNDEFHLFLEVCKRKRMDPFSRQIHAVKRWDPDLGREVMSFQIGIDGFRSQAESTGELEGIEGPFWCGPDGAWVDVWLDQKTPPVAAKYLVYRRGHLKPYVGIAHYSEYVQRKKDGTPNRMWATMPAGQIAKCAEAIAHRRAFPQQLGGFYASEEMDQAGNPPAAALPAATRTVRHADEAKEYLGELLAEYEKIGRADQYDAISESVGNPRNLTEAKKLIAALEKGLAELMAASQMPQPVQQG